MREDDIQIRVLQTMGEREIQGLSDVLIDCVEGGASVSFMLPLSRAKAEAFWSGTAASLACGERLVLVAEEAGETIVGTVQVLLQQPENQPQRGDLAKMLVHRRGPLAGCRLPRCRGGRAQCAQRRQDAVGARYGQRRGRAFVCTARLAALRANSGLRAVARRSALRDHDFLQIPAHLTRYAPSKSRQESFKQVSPASASLDFCRGIYAQLNQ